MVSDAISNDMVLVVLRNFVSALTRSYSSVLGAASALAASSRALIIAWARSSSAKYGPRWKVWWGEDWRRNVDGSAFMEMSTWFQTCSALNDSPDRHS